MIHFKPENHFGIYANNADPAQRVQNAVGDQDQHCLLTGISKQNTIEMKTFTRIPKTRNKLVQIIRMDQSTSRKGLQCLGRSPVEQCSK